MKKCKLCTKLWKTLKIELNCCKKYKNRAIIIRQAYGLRCGYSLVIIKLWSANQPLNILELP